eukprot:NODE_1447_length_599_cov_608.689091_g1142_i1.p1 GENE.NODE_1447_length_599_cov_608.689091_g1142_i1~~NODE_1447_length_599_cov_608.689091_g1142_i1.p1  ORF type:complete len:137 (-),score=17.03 NODE_1447_length_599_cov_608.689091_g1142_i1:84-494(-)
MTPFMEGVKQECRTQGSVRTILGRRRFLSSINSTNMMERSHAERQAVNTVVQGSAADVIKRAMIEVHDYILQNTGKHVRLICQVHDELLFAVKDQDIAEVAPKLGMLMQNVMSLRVPLRTKILLGKTWGSLQPFQK